MSQEGVVLHAYPVTLTDTLRQVLELLGIPTERYTDAGHANTPVPETPRTTTPLTSVRQPRDTPAILRRGGASDEVQDRAP